MARFQKDDRVDRRKNPWAAPPTYPAMKAEREAAYRFFVAVLGIMDGQRLDEISSAHICREVGIGRGNRAPAAFLKHLAVAGLNEIILGFGGRLSGPPTNGLCRKQVQRALGRLKPARPNLYRGPWA